MDNNILKNIKFNFRVDAKKLNRIIAEEEIELHKRVIDRLFEFSSIDKAENVLQVEVENE